MKLPKSSVKHVVGDFAAAKLGDSRRVKRVLRVAAKLARMPSAPLPASLGSEADVEGAYRLMNNRRVTFEKLAEAHFEATARRAKDVGSVLVLHDTTDGAFPHLSGEEIGYLQTGKAGFKIHVSLAVEANQWRRPLGVVYAETIHRSKPSRHRGTKKAKRKTTKKKKASGIETSKWKDREYERWQRGIQASAQALSECRQVTHVADRESDSYELMCQTLDTGGDFVFRVRVDRRGREVGADTDQWSTVKQVAARCDGMVERDVPLARRRGKSAPGMNKAHAPRKMRMARLSFAATTIEIPRPKYLNDSFPETLPLNLVHVVERDPPPGEEPVEWLLYTTLEVDTNFQVAGVVDIYRARWTIEEFNSALKTGCAYEARQFETRDALLTMLALSLPIACEILWLRSRARSSPDAPATEVLSALQIRILRSLGPRPLPSTPTVRDTLLAVAAIGGHLKNNGEPGWKVLQRGLALLLNYETGWTAAQQSARRAKKI
jgi:hypothetical protein